LFCLGANKTDICYNSEQMLIHIRWLKTESCGLRELKGAPMSLFKTMTLAVASTAILVGCLCPVEAAPVQKILLRVEVGSESGFNALRSSGLPVYAQLGSTHGSVYLVGADPSGAEALKTGAHDVSALDQNMDGKTYYVVYRMPGFTVKNLGAHGRVLYEDDIQAVMEMTPKNAEHLAEAGGELRAVTLDPKPLGAFQPDPATTYEQLAAAALTADPLIQQLVDSVDSATVYQYTGGLSGEWPVTVGGSSYLIATRHTYSGTSIQKATQFAGEHLAALGLDVEYHYWSDPTYPNVIGELPGVGSPDSIVIICAHIDDMPSGSLAPGADDNASGSVAVLVAADILSQYDWHYTIRFALWTGEEQGLLGSHAYALRSYNLGEDIVGVLNLDMIAYNTIGSVRDIDLHANQSVPGTLVLADLFDDAVDAYGISLIPQIVPIGIGASDHASFTAYGYSAILGIEDLSDFNPRYHTTGDQLQYADMGYYVEFVKASVATVAHMAGLQSQPDTVPLMRTPAILTTTLLLAYLGLRVRRQRSTSGPGPRGSVLSGQGSLYGVL
jgi:hypothetical protein